MALYGVKKEFVADMSKALPGAQLFHIPVCVLASVSSRLIYVFLFADRSSCFAGEYSATLKNYRVDKYWKEACETTELYIHGEAIYPGRCELNVSIVSSERNTSRIKSFLVRLSFLRSSQVTG